MSSTLVTVKNFFIQNVVNRPRVQLSIIATFVVIFILRYLWERSLKAVEKSITDKLTNNGKKLIKSSSSSSSSSSENKTRRVDTNNTVNETSSSSETSKVDPKQQKQQDQTSNNKKPPEQPQQEKERVFSSGYERLGHVVTVRVKNEQHSDLETAAKQFASSLRGGSTPVFVVLSDTAGVQGELRQPTHAPLWIDKEGALAASKEIISKISRRGKKLGVITTTSSTSSSTSTSVTSSSSSSTSIYQLFESTLQQLSDSPTFTVHKEQATKYSLDAARVMFCSGNTTERMHFGTSVVAAGETVVDMFAGIGYFTIPLASSPLSTNRPDRIIAIEKNPESCAYLACNALLNDCVDRVVILNGDNRTTGNLFVGKANRVLMGYIPCCKEFLPRAVSFLVQVSVENNNNQNQQQKSVSFAPGSTPPSSKNGTTTATTAVANSNDEKEAEEEVGENNKKKTSSLTQKPSGIIHYHYLSESKHKDEAKATAQLHVLEGLGPQLGSLCTIEEVRVVKSYAPKKFHCVADLKF
jgi:tRNA G37 N-methylase Trm5